MIGFDVERGSLTIPQILGHDTYPSMRRLRPRLCTAARPNERRWAPGARAVPAGHPGRASRHWGASSGAGAAFDEAMMTAKVYLGAQQTGHRGNVASTAWGSGQSYSLPLHYRCCSSGSRSYCADRCSVDGSKALGGRNGAPSRGNSGGVTGFDLSALTLDGARPFPTLRRWRCSVGEQPPRSRSGSTTIRGCAGRIASRHCSERCFRIFHRNAGQRRRVGEKSLGVLGVGLAPFGRDTVDKH